MACGFLPHTKITAPKWSIEELVVREVRQKTIKEYTISLLSLHISFC
jgi:hypothetical protein